MSKELMNTTEMKEVISKRTACMKVFEHADHRFTAAIYGTPVHYMKDGRWEEIDNRLEAAADADEEKIADGVANKNSDAETAALQAAEGVSVRSVKAAKADYAGELAGESDAAAANSGDVKNISGAFRVRLSNKVKKKQMVSLGEGSRKLTWGFVDANAVKRQILQETEEQQPDSAGAVDHTADSEKEKDPTAAYAVRHLKSRILYPEAFDGVDIRYTIGPESLKEDLVLKHTDAVKVFTWRYAPGVLKARQDGADIVFEDTDGMEVYRLSAPYMTDAAGEESHGLTLTLTDDGGKKNKEVSVTLAVDTEWLQAAERVYPVVIDPVVTTTVERDKIQDCHVSSFYNTDNFYNSHILKTGKVDGSVLRSYLKFTLPAIDNTSEMVTSAWFVAIRRPGGSDQRRIDIHRVTKDWNSKTVTWDNKPSYDAKVADYIAFSGSELTRLVFDITGVVKDWYADGRNYGLMMKEHGEEEGTYNEYISSDDNLNDNTSTRPQIIIEYVSCAGLEDFWTYHQHEIGRAGTGYVNDYNGSQILVRPTYALSGSRAPISLSHVFGSSAKGADIGYGKGVRLNYHQTMVQTKIGSTDYYCQTDGDGTKRYFVQDKADNKWKDELDQTRILTPNATTSPTRYTVTDKDGNKQHFYNGFLVKEEDASGNALTILHNASKIVKLTDGSGREVRLAYGSDGHLATLTDPAGRVTAFGYTNGFLTSVTDPDGAVSRYTYDTGKSLMLTAKDPYGYQVQYAYGSIAPYRVSKVTEYAGSTEGQSLALAYGHNRTSFTDNKGRKEVYLFDNAGRTVSVRNDAGYGVSWQYLDTTKYKNRLSAATDLRFVSPQYLRGVTGGITGTGWSRYTNASHVTVEDSAAGEAYIGTKCIRIGSTSASGDGAALQNLTVKAGKRYVFSAYVKAVVNELAANGRIWLQVEDTAKNLAVVADSSSIQASTDGFQRLSVAFTAPDNGEGNAALRLLVRTRNFKGTAWFDGLQLEEGEAAGRLNLVSNNCFQNGMTDHTALQFANGDSVLKTGAAAQEQQVLKGTVNEDKVNIRAAAGTAYPVLVMAPKGTSATIHGADYDSDGSIWYAIRAKIGNKTYDGYMKGTYLNLSISGAVVTVRGVVAADNLNLRAGAGTGYSAKTMMAAGTAVGIKGAAKDSSGTKWYRLAFTKNGTQYDGYASADYVAVMRPSTSHAAPSGTLNVRTEPNTSCSVAVQIGSSDKVNIVSHAGLKNGDLWYGVKLTKGGKAYTGYVLSDLVTVSSTDAPAEIRMGQQEKVPGGNGPTGDCVLKISGDEKNNKRCYQPINISGKKGDSFMACGWGYADSVSLKEKLWDSDEYAGNSLNSRKNRHFGLHINFISSDSKDRNDIHYAEFGADCSEWQFMNTAFVANHDYVRVDIGFCYGNNSNQAYFTGLGLYKEEYGTSFAYDDKGNVVKVTDQAKKNSSFEYDGSDNLKKLLDPKGNAFKYDYDNKHRVTAATSAAGMKYTFVYDDYGNPVTARTVDPSAETDMKKAMTSKAVYTTGAAAGQYMASQTAPEGSVVTYDWDTERGELKKTTDAAGNSVSYTYDTAGRLTSVNGKKSVMGSEKEIKGEYVYEKDRLAKLVHNGCEYGFSYDGFGNGTDVLIAGTKVISHEYAAKNGNLLKSTYANGWEVTYTYDNLDRVIEVKASKDGSSYLIGRYIYDKLGRIARFVDGQVSGKSCTYGYDLTDRLCEAVFDDGTAYRYTYDANDCLVKEVQTTPDGVRTVTRAYDADSRETTVICGSAKIEKTFDKLGRLSAIKRNGGKHTTIYEYMKAPDGGETGRVACIRNGNSDQTSSLSYSYNTLGNVSRISRGGKYAPSEYEYDAQGQLVMEVDRTQSRIFRYWYNEGGNLTEVRSYPVPESGEPEGEGTVEKQFVYSNVWKDQLTAVTMDGRTRNFTYDANGNLLSDGNYTYSWTKGSQLQKVTGNGLAATYTYDASGIRTSKTVNGVTTEYLTAGGSVLSEKKNGIWQHYLYDGSGQLMAIRYKGADYYYIRDGLMTITGLVDANGAAVVNYRYDSWGRLLGITGSLAETLGKDNPYRFKGYYYDEETGMYYLKSRYYQPEICRFISADDISIMLDNPMSLWDKNLYVYGDNDPVNKKDDDGEIAQFVAMGIIGAVTNVGISFIASKVTGQDYGWKDAVVDAAVGALSAIIPAWEIKEVSRFYVYKDVIKGGVSKGVSVIGEFIKGGNTKESLGSAILSLATPDVAKYGKLGLLKEELLKEKVIETAINAPFEMAYSLITSAGKQARKTSASRKNSKVNNDYKVLRNRLVKRGRIAYHEIQYRYRGRIYYSRIYM